jgi:hypothetical protein
MRQILVLILKFSKYSPSWQGRKTHQNRNKKTDFADIVISNVLLDFPFSRNQAL